MRVYEQTEFKGLTGFIYPRHLDGKARSDLQSEVRRLLFKANVDDVTLFDLNREIVVAFEEKSDQDKFYKAFKELSDYSLNEIFSSPRATTPQWRIRAIHRQLS